VVEARAATRSEEPSAWTRSSRPLGGSPPVTHPRRRLGPLCGGPGYPFVVTTWAVNEQVSVPELYRSEAVKVETLVMLSTCTVAT
jgi:hypothetical protein